MKYIIFLFFFIIYPIKICYISTVGKCGVAVYSNHLVNKLNDLGHNAFIIDSNLNNNEIIEQIKNISPNIINLQYAAGLSAIKTREDILDVIKWANKQNIKCILTIHENSIWLKNLIDYFDYIIVHKKNLIIENDPKYHFIPMSVPLYNPKYSNEDLRRKYNFKEDDIIISTFGFMMKWKQHDKIIESFIPYIKKNNKIKLQILSSFPSYMKKEDQEKMSQKILEIINNSSVKDNIILNTKFLSEEEINERLFMSDIGFLWGTKEYGTNITGVNGNTTSASDKQFISARLPLILVDCPHYHASDVGTIKIQTNEISYFVYIIIDSLKNKKILKSLKIDMNNKYKNLSIDVIINKHLELFIKLINN